MIFFRPLWLTPNYCLKIIDRFSRRTNHWNVTQNSNEHSIEFVIIWFIFHFQYNHWCVRVPPRCARSRSKVASSVDRCNMFLKMYRINSKLSTKFDEICFAQHFIEYKRHRQHLLTFWDTAAYLSLLSMTSCFRKVLININLINIFFSATGRHRDRNWEQRCDVGLEALEKFSLLCTHYFTIWDIDVFIVERLNSNTAIQLRVIQTNAND